MVTMPRVVHELKLAQVDQPAPGACVCVCVPAGPGAELP